jgi:hypothetical protein
MQGGYVPFSFSQQAIIARPGELFSMEQLLTSPGTGSPAYVVLVGLDRDRYASDSGGSSGHFDGNGQRIDFEAAAFSDCGALGVVFTLGPDGYSNSTYGRLDQLKFTGGSGEYRNELLSLYGFGADGKADPALLAKLEAEVANPFFDGGAFMAPRNYPDAIHLGALDIVTRASYSDATPNAATPDEIAAVAKTFLGAVWNDNGCWVLANNIAAAAGASLPMTANETLPGLVPPVSNGPWFVAYNSSLATEGQRLNWQAQLRPGDIVVSNDSCGGHVATVIDGFGHAALYLDNNGPAAIGGSIHDIVIGTPASKGPWNYTDLANIVIYRLDTPVVDVVSGLCVAAGGSALLAPLFTAADPAGKAVTSYQFYSTGSGTIGGVAAHDAAGAVTVSAQALASASFTAGAKAGADSIMVRAFNGSYWGDWESVQVAVGSTTRPAQVSAKSDTLYIHGGASVALASLFEVDAGPAPITSYTITQSPFGGTVQLNGAVDLLGGTKDATAVRQYQVSAADFAKLTFVSGMYSGAETLSVTAHNGAALDSVAATVAVAAVTPLVDGISRVVASGSQVALSSLFAVTLQDAVPATYYLVNTDVRVIDWGDFTPSYGKLELNGARDLLAGTGAPAGSYQIPAADLAKVTFHAGAGAGVQFLQVWAMDGGVGAAGNLTLTTVDSASPLHAAGASVDANASIAAASLFALSAGAAPLYYRFLDPNGAGSLRLDTSASNLASKSDTTPGEFIIAASELNMLAYVGADVLGGASEALTVSTSTDLQHWTAEASLPVATRARTLQAVAGGSGDDRLAGSARDEAFDGGAGIDSVSFTGARSQYLVVHGATGWNARDLTGAQGSDVLANVERLLFADGALALDIEGQAGSLYRLYQAAFDRKPDAAGMGWWLGQVDHGTALLDVAAQLVHSNEFVQKYGAQMDNAAYVGQLYQNVLHRAGDSAGTAFWRGALDAGMTREAVLAQFADSGENVAQVVGSIQNGIAYVPY